MFCSVLLPDRHGQAGLHREAEDRRVLESRAGKLDDDRQGLLRVPKRRLEAAWRGEVQHFGQSLLGSFTF